MDWFSGMFSWETVGWAALGMLALALFAFIARIWRGGLGTYGESHKKMAQRIRETSAEIRERNNAMSASEQLQILDAALHEVLELEGNPPGCVVRHCESGIGLDTPQGRWVVLFAQRQSTLRGQRRTVHGTGQWQVRHEGAASRYFADLGQLMRYLRTVLHPGEHAAAEGGAPEFTRRFARRPQRARK